MRKSERELEQEYRKTARELLLRWTKEDDPALSGALDWVLGRYREGVEIAALLNEELGRDTGRVLDLGAGNGGVSIGLVAASSFRVTACDCRQNGEVAELRDRMSLRFDYLVGLGEQLPFADETFDAVLLLDVVEHVREVRRLLASAVRVLRPSGLLVITTPPRTKFLFKGDPHFRIPGLVLLPAKLQKVVAESWLHRTENYDVHHLYWSRPGLARLLPVDGLEPLPDKGGLLAWKRLLWRKRGS